jgi:hypothetical protein
MTRNLPLLHLIISTFMITITLEVTAQMTADFNSGIPAGWTTNSQWAHDTSTPINGAGSIRHNNNGYTSGSSVYTCASAAVDGSMSNISGVNTTWSFKVNTFAKSVGAGSKFWVVLASDVPTPFASSTSNVAYGTPSEKFSGYAIGINPYGTTPNNTRKLQLMRVDAGVATRLTEITGGINSTTGPTTISWTSTSAWGYGAQSIPNAVGITVVRDAAGSWTVDVDFDGNGTSDASSTALTDLTYSDMSYVGLTTLYTTSSGTPVANSVYNNFSFDDLSISQTSTAATYYSIASGNMSSGSVWSLTDGGAAVTPSFNINTDIIVKHAVTIDGSYNLSDVTISTGGSLTAGGTAQSLTLSGNWTNNNATNSFAPKYSSSCCSEGCAVIMAGSSAQTIGGTVGTQFMDLTINNAAGVTLNAPVFVSNAVYPDAGTLTTDGSGGSLSLLSSTTCSGSIQTIASGADVSGPVTLQRYIPSNSASNWLFLSCPLYSNSALSSRLSPSVAWGAKTVNGVSYPALSMTSNTVKWYNETLSGVSNFGFTVVNPTSGQLNPMLGYNVFTNSSAKTINPTGYFGKGTRTASLTYTASGAVESYGRNLISNPFPSEIDWSVVENNSSNIGAYFVYDYQSSNYLYYNNNDGTFNTSAAYPDGIGKYIPHSQSFFVIATSGGQIVNFPESAKVSRCSPKAFERSEGGFPVFAMEISTSDNRFKDQSNIILNPEAQEGYDEGLDIPDMFDADRAHANISFVTNDNQVLVANSIHPDKNVEMSVQLDVMADGADQAILSVNRFVEGEWYFTVALPTMQYSQDGQSWNTIHSGDVVQFFETTQLSVPIQTEMHGQIGSLTYCPQGGCINPSELTGDASQLEVLLSRQQMVVRNAGQTLTQVMVMDALGKNIQSWNGSTAQWEWDVDGFAKGVYLVQATNESGQVMVQKVVLP